MMFGRGADEGDDTAEQRAKRHRHQQRRHRLVVSARELEGDRHQHGERTDVLDERREHRHHPGERQDLRAGAREMPAEAAQQALDWARARDRRAHEQRGSCDNHDVVGETRERLIVRHDARGDRGQQHEHGDEVVAQPPPHEQAHHRGDDGEGEQLLQRHREAPDP
jgi:hypothetical protein